MPMDETRTAQEGRFDGTVAVWFSQHYAVDTRDWDNIKEFGNAYHPLAGYYTSDERAVLRQQLHWMRRAGIDLIVYDAYSTRKMNQEDLPEDKTLQLLVEELASQEAESHKLHLCIWLETYLGNPTLEEYDFALNHVREQLSKHSFYYRYDGKPLVVLYLNGNCEAVDEVEWKNDYFSLHRIRPYQSDVWSYVQHYPQKLRKEWMPASPGIDSYLELAYIAKYVKKDPSPNYEEIRRTASRADREDGAFYRRQLAWAKQANPEIIFVSGWNDWQYGTQIEPAVEYEFLYVDLTAEVLGRRQETEPYR